MAVSRRAEANTSASGRAASAAQRCHPMPPVVQPVTSTTVRLDGAGIAAAVGRGGAAAGRWCSELAAALAAGWRAAVHALQRNCLRSRRGARRSLERIVDAAAPAAGCGADTQRPSGAQHRSGGRPGRGALVPSLARKAQLSGGSGGGDGARTDEAQSLAASEAGCRGRGAKAGALRRSRRHRHSATAALRRLPPANSRPHRPPLHPSAQPTHLSVLKANAISDLQRGAHEGAALREWC